VLFQCNFSVRWRADRDTRRASQVINGSGKVTARTYEVRISEPDPELEVRLLAQ
jgi:hypothetical protein